MNPDRGIIHTYRRSDCLSTIPDGPNTLTRQYASTNDTPRDPQSLALLHGGEEDSSSLGRIIAMPNANLNSKPKKSDGILYSSIIYPVELFNIS